MADSYFDVDSVLDSIKNKLQKQSSLGESIDNCRQDIIELTDMVDDFGESLSYNSYVNNTVDSGFLEDKSISDIYTQLGDLSERVAEKNKFDKLKTEVLIREEIRNFLRPWMNENLSSLVRSQVKDEIQKISERFKNGG